jgi:uncharacterized FlgJ-related protein
MDTQSPATEDAANESAFGASGLAQRGKNLFGIKAVGVKTPYWDGSIPS